MEWLLVLNIGILVTSGVYLILQKQLIRIILGLNIFSQAINLIIFVSGYNGNHRPAFILSPSQTLNFPASDPLPQALILTAIVIGFALIAFFVVLVRRVFLELHSDDVTKMESSDRWL
ncbi:MAG: NADH-quinone oxidoreductase subunit K [Bdellovibrionaceae bacterium]|nr:NADH-quinone oxidoreductase subunit K [Pseudobdellovibrionaceae bacterium]MDW8189901.1 NADH-quinone oxidoreductase subunit K [Pseudobdellovibrionaceae bacterium]